MSSLKVLFKLDLRSLSLDVAAQVGNAWFRWKLLSEFLEQRSWVVVVRLPCGRATQDRFTVPGFGSLLYCRA